MNIINHKLEDSLAARRLIIAAGKLTDAEKAISDQLIASGIVVIGSHLRFPDGSTQGSATIISSGNIDGGTYT